MMATKDAKARVGRARTPKQAVLDGIATRLFKLPKATSSYRVLRDERVPMSDGVELLADVLIPSGVSKGTLLSRTPYGWDPVVTALLGGIFARRGYTVVLARCRGTFGSGGVFAPFVNERQDGSDTVVWLRRQSWFTGKFATFGASYAGFTQWGILAENPPELVTGVLTTTCHNFRRELYRDGAFMLDTWFDWSERIPRQADGGFMKVMRADSAAAKVAPASKAMLPLDTGADVIPNAPWYRRWISDQGLQGEEWAGYDATAQLEAIEVPVLVQVGWQDPFLDQGIGQVASLQERGVDVALTAGPWTHRGSVLAGGSVTMREALEWFDQHFGHTGPHRSAPVKAFINGSEEWVELPSWPPASRDVEFFPAESGGLVLDGPQHGEAGFTYDPSDPTPTLGGPILPGGYRDDAALAARSDVLTFTSAPLSREIRILGAPKMELEFQADNPHLDFFVRISILDSKDVSRNVSEGFVRLDPAADAGTVTVELDETGQKFAVGERVRVIVAGGCFPQWERNLGTGDQSPTSSRLVPSTRTISLGASRLVLPVLESGGRTDDEK